MRFSKFLITFGIIFLILAVVLVWQRNNPKRIVFNSTPIYSSKVTARKKIPTRIQIDKIRVDLPILPAKINGQLWETTSLGVSWLESSPVPGETGNSVIYGHNWTNLLGNLIYVKPGNYFKIFYNDGTSKRFVIDDTVLVAPDDVSVIRQSDNIKITIYTCAGLFDQKRFVAVGKPL